MFTNDEATDYSAVFVNIQCWYWALVVRPEVLVKYRNMSIT